MSPPDISSTRRFIGDLNPEVVFQLPANSSNIPNTAARVGDVGVWLEGSSSNEAESSQIAGRPRLPPRAEQQALLDIYFTGHFAILPIVDEDAIRQSFFELKLSTILMQAIFLTAAKDNRAEKHLYLGSSAERLPVRKFVRVLYEQVCEKVRSGKYRDKILLIQTLALLSLHSEGVNGIEQSSMLLSQAINHAHTIALHLGEGTLERSVAFRQRLFACLWTIDKVNAAMGGRPVMLHDRDNSPKSWPTVSFSIAFDIWLRIARLLDRVIEFYRPTASHTGTGWESDFPGFSEILEDVGAVELQPPIVGKCSLMFELFP